MGNLRISSDGNLRPADFIIRPSMRFLFTIAATLCGYLITAQTVSGVVTDAESGEPIIGASVLETGTDNNGTVTDFEGKYTLDLQTENPTLIVSYVGFQSQEIQYNGQGNINVQLASGLALDEVVVTALGIKRETKALGYAMTELDGRELSLVNTVNPVEALQGKSAGLSIGVSDGGLFGNNKIQLRGVSVLNSGNNQPIFVIDGVIIQPGVSNASADWSASANDFGNILKNLNPDNIESVSVLKGAAATALYGSRGINGAIVIKNKDGKNQQGIGVSVTQSVGITDVYATPDIQYDYGPGTLAGYVGYGDRDENGNYYRFDVDQAYTREVDGQQVMSKIQNAGSGLGYGPKFDGRPIEDFDGTIRRYEAFPNNMLNAYSTGVNSNTALALSGGNENGNFYLSNSYNHRTGIMPTDEFNRNSLLFKGSYNLASWLTADASMTFTTSKSKNPFNNISGNFLSGTWENWYDTERWSQRDVYQAPHGGTPNSNYGDEFASVPGNNVWFEYNLNDFARKEQVIRPIVRLTANLADWISVSAEANMNFYSRFYERKALGSGYAMDGGAYELRNDQEIARTGKLSANLNKKWGDLTSNLILGGEIWDRQNQFTRSWTDGGLIVPGRFYLSNSKRNLRTEGAVNGTEQINSLYFLASLGWKDQLYLDITGRNDWSSTLIYTNGTGNYSYFYPSISASWILSETFELPDLISFGKLRASFAQVGNDTNPYTINNGYSLGTIELAGGNFIYSNTKSTTLVDPNIRPEKKNSLEVGLDFRLFTGRISTDIAYYNESITNQIGTIPIPSATGFGSMFTNIGTLTNKGFELSLSVIPVQIRDFEWETTFNYWNNTTIVSDLRDEVGDYKALGGDVAYGNFRVGSVAFENGEYGVLMSDTKPLEDGNGNKILTWADDRRGAFYTRSNEIQEIGKVNPDFEGSWNNAFKYKNFNLSILLDARFGGHIASYSNKYGTAYGYLQTSLANRDEEHGGITWTSEYEDTKGRTYHDGMIPDGVFAEGQKVTAPSGEQVDVGGMSYQEAYDAGFVEPTHASFNTYFNSAWSSGVINDNWFNEVKYIALRNISLGYSFPKILAQKVGAKSLYLAFNARNLAYLYNSLPNNLNPESFRGTTSSDSFRERSFTPYSANYTFTLSIDF
ncbi:SusC/RagA family TonB-linked outer membrane protein [Membranihabitans maritimus]|uniref:SusC/RagA family TonB-linked outer membrane protein n=1 Tax=Membranihabitans maritimus TaxID=2904244 RepID=UPI001F02E062|nr:SusC/RagA family TonB-linked outer membrane protein [Membranihabitans maritimus]